MEKFSRRVAKKEEQEVYQHSQAPERILIPLSNPKTMESLLDLAFILKTKQSNEPLYPISIVQKNSGREIEEIAEAEKMLGHAVMYASGADIPIRLLTRVDHNPAKGIIRATTDTRISMIIGGWNGRLSTPQKIFGGVLDQVLNQTSVMLVVSRLCTPINTTNKIVVFLPPSSYKKASFNETIRLINKMATQLSVSILFIVINEDIYDYKKRIKKGRSSNFQFQLVKDWSELQSYYSYVHKDHLFILVSARRGTVSWHPHLEVLPRNLAKCENNFLVMYPEEQKEIDERGARGTSIPTTMFKKEYD